VIGFTTPETITFSVAAFFGLLAILVFARLLTRRTPPTWRRYKIGFFVERTAEDIPWPQQDTKAGPGVSEQETWHK
jgi:hypothetical protein